MAEVALERPGVASGSEGPAVSTIDRIVRDLRKHAQPLPEPEYLCAACKDTGWIETDDGLEDGKRVRSAQEARCTSLAHQVKKSVKAPTIERFS